MKSKKTLSQDYDDYCDKINKLSKSFINTDLKKTINLIKKVKKKNLKLYYLEMVVAVL